MKQTINISATVDHPEQLESLVSKLAIRRNEYGGKKGPLPGTWVAVDTSSTETFMSGTIMFSDGNELLHIPFITRFIFSCVKESGGDYKVAFSQSLS